MYVEIFSLFPGGCPILPINAGDIEVPCLRRNGNGP